MHLAKRFGNAFFFLLQYGRHLKQEVTEGKKNMFGFVGDFRDTTCLVIISV